MPTKTFAPHLHIVRSAMVCGGIAHGEHFVDALSRMKSKHQIGPDELSPVVRLDESSENMLTTFRSSHPVLRRVDRVAVLAAAAAHEAASPESHVVQNERVGISVGSSRGPTDSLEQAIHTFSSKGKVASQTSPITTFGNIATTIAQCLNIHGFSSAHSATCTSGLLSVLQGYAFLKAGLLDAFIAVGAEAPITPFTLAQMEALGIKAQNINLKYPCQPLSSNRDDSSGLMLGEGAAAFFLRTIRGSELPTNGNFIKGIGFGSEAIGSLTGISEEGRIFQESMHKALHAAGRPPIDLILPHAPGTKQGDMAEMRAIQEVFRGQPPSLYSPKWLIGHTFGASGSLALILALEILDGLPLPSMPYRCFAGSDSPLSCTPRNIMINSAGFGGIACSVIVGKAT
ncbi:MAG: hypothetical protein KDD60_10205 [Bdellovibrionales bacterium]|nr:hypothetical protein [Bdellovibrionales bacterium]